MKRVPVVAGRFYPGKKQNLEQELGSFCSNNTEKKKAWGCIMPHAGYLYSGKTAGEVISRIKITDTVIILGPNHTGQGSAFSIYPEGEWETPLGGVEVDRNVVSLLQKGSNLLEEDYSAHQFEHSIEVEIPFLQYFRRDIKIVPICLGGGTLEDWKRLGEEIARVVQENSLDILVIASSDMSHYEPLAVAKRKDKIALDAIVNLDAESLIENIRQYNISMCGYIPVTVLLSFAKMQGAKTAKIVDYTTSGEVSGDAESVVGYAGVVIYKEG